MKITIKVKLAKEFAAQSPEFAEYVNSRFWHARDEDVSDIDISTLSIEELDKLQAMLKESKEDEKSLAGPLQKIAAYKKIKSDPDNVVVNNLEQLLTALKEYIGNTSSRKWLYKMANDNMKLPYLVTHITYKPAETKGDYTSPAETVINMSYNYLDETQKSYITFHYQDLKLADSKKSAGLTVGRLLEMKNYIAGTDEIDTAYDQEMDVFLKYRDEIGEQFVSSGSGINYGRHSHSRGESVNLSTEGVSHKLVMDEPSSHKITGGEYMGGGYWEKNSESIMRVPVHPYVRMFNLKTHNSVVVHTSLLTHYVYKPELIHKLVIPTEVKELVEILGTGTSLGLGDIISGKAEGIIIGCVGPPGTGKTLTAEIYSEFLKRPLYIVQCSQLGTKPDDLEKKLEEVLERSSRWKAILLLDEADVYIRTRGTDIMQNAIVGVFLRVLEYYRGIIFMTTNLGDCIDDAIESRFTAKIEYTHPNVTDAKEIWKLQLINHGWNDDKVLIDAMVGKYPNLSGRSIRSVIKLATLLSKFRKEEISLVLLEHAIKFCIGSTKNKIE